jgi:hypothetical protein
MVTHVPTGDATLCPVRALERQANHLLQHQAPLDTPLYAYYDENGTQKMVTSRMVTLLLRRGAAIVEDQTGIAPKKISARSLRPGGATALLCAGQEPTSIALVGRWRSEAMLRYLRANITPAAMTFAKLMLTHGNFTFHKKVPPADEATASIINPDQAPAATRDLFDLTDDASDDDAI